MPRAMWGFDYRNQEFSFWGQATPLAGEKNDDYDKTSGLVGLPLTRGQDGYHASVGTDLLGGLMGYLWEWEGHRDEELDGRVHLL